MEIKWDDYFVADFSTGVLIWKKRTEGFAKDRDRRAWNTRLAGNVAGRMRPGGYREVRLFGSGHLAHRILWEMANGRIPAGYDIDHRDQDKGNNQLSNLRLATKAQNNMNRGAQKNNVSGVKGVCFVNGRWKAYINNGTRIHLGYFTTIEDATAARAAGEAKHHGEYACAM